MDPQVLLKLMKSGFLPVGGYGITKAALNMLGRQWSKSLEPKGVAVVLVHPVSFSSPPLHPIEAQAR